MSRMISWNDEYCPNGHSWVFCSTSTLYPDYYYCPDEDKMWEPTVKAINEKKVAENYNVDRPDAMRQYAKRNLALEKIKKLSFDEIIALSNKAKEESL